MVLKHKTEIIMKGKRTNIDFSKHELTVIESEHTTIYKFKKPNTVVHGLTFINSCGILAVTGDFGNWIFCREFHPSEKGSVSDGYWDEKLQIASVQKSHEFCSDETLKRIDEFEREFENYYGRPMNEPEGEWIEELKGSLEDEFDYISAARNYPGSIDFESVPIGKVRNSWLNAVYDAFDIMCQLSAQPERKEGE